MLAEPANPCPVQGMGRKSQGWQVRDSHGQRPPSWHNTGHREGVWAAGASNTQERRPSPCAGEVHEASACALLSAGTRGPRTLPASSSWQDRCPGQWGRRTSTPFLLPKVPEGALAPALTQAVLGADDGLGHGVEAVLHPRWSQGPVRPQERGWLLGTPSRLSHWS